MMNTLSNFETWVDEAEKKVMFGFKPITRQPMSWREELVEAARQIRAATDRPLYLCLSGGIDSEVMARAFVEAGIEFQALAMRHVQYTNEHEMIYAIDWCAKNNVNLNFLPLDTADFFTRGIEKYISMGYYGGVTTFSIYTYLYMMEYINEIGGSAVMGMGEPIFANKKDQICLEFLSYRHTSYRFLQINKNHVHFPWFFLSTPELLASYLREELVDLIVSDPRYYASPLPNFMQSLEKPIVYHKYFPDMMRRPKGTGWERFKSVNYAIDRWIGARSDRYKNDREMTMYDEKHYTPLSDVKLRLGI